MVDDRLQVDGDGSDVRVSPLGCPGELVSIDLSDHGSILPEEDLAVFDVGLYRRLVIREAVLGHVVDATWRSLIARLVHVTCWSGARSMVLAGTGAVGR